MATDDTPEPLRIELSGGPYDGEPATVPRLGDHTVLLLPAPFDPMDTYAVATGAEPAPYPEPLTYRLVWDPDTGGPALNAAGRIRYQHRASGRTFPHVPLWLVQAFPKAYRWRTREVGHWTARQASDVDPHTWQVTRWEHLWVAFTMAPEGSVTYNAYVASPTLPEQFVGGADEFERQVWNSLEQRIEHALLPGCVVPECTAKGTQIFHAAAAGRLAGRRWNNGDAIHLCHPHAFDVMRVDPWANPDDVAPWLRPDLRPDPDPFTDPQGWLAHHGRALMPIAEREAAWHLRPAQPPADGTAP